jgi:hypothetical protein
MITYCVYIDVLKLFYYSIVTSHLYTGGAISIWGGIMTTATLTSFGKESPSERICRSVSSALLKEMKRAPGAWPAKDRKTAVACIRHLACNIDSPASQRHTVHGKARYIRLSQEQSDLLQYWYLEALWDEPAAL